MNLWHVGNNARPLPDGILVEGFVIKSHLAGLRPQQTKQSPEKRGLAAAIRPQQRQHLAGRKSDIEAVTHRMVRITDGEIPAFDVHDQILFTTKFFSRPGPFHDQVLCILASSQMKNGVPITAVKMPSGISTSATVRASVSIKSR